MNEIKIGFTKTENAVLQTEQLSRNEKWFYTVLKSFRHNSPPIRCNPGLPRIEKRAHLSHPTALKIRKSLEKKGLIKIESRGPGAGRTRTNNYIFTLEDGTDKERERLLDYLKAKKNSKILTHFKDKKTVKKKTVLSKENGLDFNEKTVKKKTSNKKYLNKNKPLLRVREFIEIYFRGYKKEFGDAPEIRKGKDGKLVHQMLMQHTVETLTRLLPLFWELKDELIEKNGHTIGMFKVRFNKLIELRKEKEKWWKKGSSTETQP